MAQSLFFIILTIQFAILLMILMGWAFAKLRIEAKRQKQQTASQQDVGTMRPSQNPRTSKTNARPPSNGRKDTTI